MAEDAKFAFERYSKEDLYTPYYLNVASFEALNASTRRINMKPPVADFS